MTGSRRIEDANTRHAVELLQKAIADLRKENEALRRLIKQSRAPKNTVPSSAPPMPTGSRKRKPSRKSTS